MAAKTENHSGNKGAAIAGGLLVVGGAVLLLVKGKTSRLLGTVVSGENNAPIAGAHIQVGTVAATSDATGKFTMTVKPGDYTCTIIATGFITYAQPITIEAGDNTKTFQLFKTSTAAGLSGRVTNVNTGGPLVGVNVSVAGHSGITNSNGVYTISGLTAGNGTVTFTLTGYKTKTAAITLVVGANTLDMTMNNLGTVQGTVRDSVTSVPLSGVSVTINGSVVATTNANGGYSLIMASGDYQVGFTKTGYQQQTQPLTIEPELTVPLDIQLIENFSNNGTVQGTVANAQNGNPIPGAALTFTAPDNTPYAAFANSLGQYSIELPGSTLGITYALAVTATDFNSYSSSALVRTGAFTTKNVAMTPIVTTPGSVIGAVYTQGWLPIQGATVMLQDTHPLIQATTDQNGLYRMSNVPAGNYTIWANANGYAQQSKDIVVDSGFETVVPVFQLVPIQQAIGFYMIVDFDPSNWPSAAIWFADINGAVLQLLHRCEQPVGREPVGYELGYRANADGRAL